MAYAVNQYLTEALNNQLAALEVQTAAQKQQTLQQMQANLVASNTDYKKIINPYGVQAEALAGTGIRNSGANESSKIMAYGAYQKNIGATRSDASRQNSEIDTNLLTGKNNAYANYNQNVASDYNRYQDMEYQRHRDAVADSQWERQFAYQKRHSGGGGGGGRSYSSAAVTPTTPATPNAPANTPAPQKSTTNTLLDMYGGEDWYKYI
jgi:hypothetical protein